MSGNRILIVEDEEAIAKMIAMNLEVSKLRYADLL